jgi:hypothetical protein
LPTVLFSAFRLPVDLLVSACASSPVLVGETDDVTGTPSHFMHERSFWTGLHVAWRLAGRLTGRHAGMAFVADDLAAWLFFILGEAGRRKLTTLVLGTEQERALRSAATAAVQLTARELRPGDDEQAEHVALVISQVFREPVAGTPTAEHQTMLETLQAGIPGQGHGKVVK